MKPIVIGPGLARRTRFYPTDDPAVPPALFTAPALPQTDDIDVPLPSRRRDYTSEAVTKKARWLGAKNGLTRYAFAPDREADRVLWFSADRDLPENEVLSVFAPDPEKEEVWVRTPSHAVRISLEEISAEEKARMLTEESHRWVDRHGMVTQRRLTEARTPESAVNYGHSDNSGTFTASFAVGELCRYAVTRDKYGPLHEKTRQAKQSAVRALEACLLLCYISGRGDGFVARTYLAPHEPIPEDGLFYRIEGHEAVCVDLPQARERGIVGLRVKADAPVPERLTHLYTDEGLVREGLVYKGDTSSDELTHHYLLFWFAHRILGAEDPELDAMVKDRAEAILDHILSHGRTLCECDGKPTTWARWDKPYFATPLGW